MMRLSVIFCRISASQLFPSFQICLPCTFSSVQIKKTVPVFVMIVDGIGPKWPLKKLSSYPTVGKKVL